MRFHTLQIRSTRGLSHADTCDHVTRCHLGQVAVFLLFRTKVEQIVFGVDINETQIRE